MTSVQLTHDEIRTLMLFVSQFQAAKAKSEMAQELEEQYMAQLRAKYQLSDEWHCLDLLDGFVRVEGGSQP